MSTPMYNSPEGSCTNNNNNVPGGVSTPMTGAKWPMRPGVLVHVNTNHSLLSSTPNGRSPNESQASRASRIRAMFGPDQPGGSLPGVFHSKSGVVTFKRLEPSSETNSLSRKRKSPGGTAGPNPANNKDLASSPNDALLSNDADKAFYENLPFHNMANPQNKASRPPSRISSGYGSSRSQKIARPARKFLTVRPLGSKPRNWPQFRSLRLTKSKNSPPVPAPRQYFPKTQVAYHSYQNVPPPKGLSQSDVKDEGDGRDKDEEKDVNAKTPSVAKAEPSQGPESAQSGLGDGNVGIVVSSPSVYKQPPPKLVQVTSGSVPPSQVLVVKPLPANTSKPKAPQLAVKPAPPVIGPKPYPLTLSVTSLMTSTTSSPSATTVNTRLYPVARTSSITSRTRTTKPVLTHATKTVTTPLARNDTKRSPGALLLARLSPATKPPSVRRSESILSSLGTSTMLVTKRPLSTAPSKPQSEPASPTRLIKPASLPVATPISRRPSSVQRSESSVESRTPVITGVVPKKFEGVSPRMGCSSLERPPKDRQCKSDSEDAKTEEPYKPQYPDLEYADVDYRSYGPINYKAASMTPAQPKQEELL